MKALKELLSYFRYFQAKLGSGLYWLIAIFFIGSYLNGLGISLLLPLLKLDSIGEDGQFPFLAKIFLVFGAKPNLTNLLILFSITFAIKGVLQFFQEWYRTTLTVRLITKLQREMAESYSKLNFSYYSKTKSGFFTNLFTNESNNLVTGLQAFIMFLGAFMNSAVLFVFAYAINRNVTIGTLIAGALVFFSSAKMRDEVTRLSRESAHTNGSLAHHFIQFIVGFKYLKSIEGYFRYTDRIEHELKVNETLQFRKGFLKAVVGAIYEPLTVIFLCLIIYNEVVREGKNIAEIAVPLILLNRFLTSFFAFQRSWHDFSGAIGSIAAFEDGMKTLALNQENNKGQAVEPLQKAIEVKELSFSYGEKLILDRVNLLIPKNKCVAIVGDSGSGKTTFLNILTALLPASSGSISFDTLEYADLDKVELRAKFGYVTQEAVLFDSTVENNITLWKGKPDVNGLDTRLTEAARSAYCLDFIQNSQGGFSSVIGDRGTAISGGQRQRLVIAREIYRNPEILVFDEATSSLDSESEGYIQETIRSFLGNKTMVIVAHRVSSLRYCDYIYVLKEGRIVEQGTWADLLKEGKETYFSKMHAAQRL